MVPQEKLPHCLQPRMSAICFCEKSLLILFSHLGINNNASVNVIKDTVTHHGLTLTLTAIVKSTAMELSGQFSHSEIKKGECPGSTVY